MGFVGVTREGVEIAMPQKKPPKGIQLAERIQERTLLSSPLML
jgi:hypothetical protein